MSRPIGSKNRVKESAAPAAPEQSQGTYSEGTGRIVIPESNSAARLFPEQISAPEPQKPDAKPEPQPQEPEPVQPGQQPEQPKEPEVKPEVTPEPVAQEQGDVYLEDLLQKMNIDPAKVKTRTKVDGVEGEASILDVKKNYQLEQHLTKRGQKIGEQRRELEQLRNELARQAQQKPVNAEDPSLNADPNYVALKQDLEHLKSILPAIQPVIYQNARQQLANELKDQGFPDFMQYIDKIDARVAAEPDDNKWNYYNTKEGAKQLYFQMKLEEQMNGQKKAAAQPVQPTPAPVPAKKPPVVKIDGGSQPSGGNVDDYNTRYTELMSKFRSSRDRLEKQALLREILVLKQVV